MPDALHWQRDDARARFDAAGFAAALDATRATRGLSWRQVAAEAKVSPSTLTRLGAGHRPDMDGFAALADWLGTGTDRFIQRTQPEEPVDPPDLALLVEGLLHDPVLGATRARALVKVVMAAYEAFLDLPERRED